MICKRNYLLIFALTLTFVLSGCFWKSASKKSVYDEDSYIQKSSQNSSELSLDSEDTENSTNNLGFVTKGKDKYQGFTIDNIYHSPNDGDIH